jgi:hypothetical protein
MYDIKENFSLTYKKLPLQLPQPTGTGTGTITSETFAIRMF